MLIKHLLLKLFCLTSPISTCVGKQIFISSRFAEDYERILLTRKLIILFAISSFLRFINVALQFNLQNTTGIYTKEYLWEKGFSLIFWVPSNIWIRKLKKLSCRYIHIFLSFNMNTFLRIILPSFFIHTCFVHEHVLLHCIWNDPQG